MGIEFEIIKIDDHHNRGQFIFARQLNFKESIIIKEGSLLNGISIYHYLEMYPFLKEDAEPRFDIYVFRPTEIISYKKEYFLEGQIVKLIINE